MRGATMLIALVADQQRAEFKSLERNDHAKWFGHRPQMGEVKSLERSNHAECFGRKSSEGGSQVL